MLRMAERGHNVVYAGCIGMRSYLQMRAKGKSSGRHQPTKQNAGVLAYENLSYSPLTASLAGLRQSAALKSLNALIEKTFGSQTARPRLLWLYHPSLLDLGSRTHHDAIVYDVMDRFAAFSASRSTINSQEQITITAANAVFTGGRSIHAACKPMLNGMSSKPFLCFPSGVDLPHFGTALNNETAVPQDIAHLPRPILGYFGAVDERIDFDLLDEVCLAKPNFSVVLIGPVLVKTQSHPPNLHLLGARPYSSLPAYVKGFDVCLLPFRTSELVAHVSPTKTPEYLAGGRPVVSTLIPDVVTEYGDILTIASTVDEFITGCEYAIENPQPRTLLADEAGKRARTWEQIATEMEAIVGDLLATRLQDRA